MTRQADYQVKVERSGSWWAISVPELPGLFSQAKRLDKVDSIAREAIALMLDVKSSQIGQLKIEVVPRKEIADLLQEADLASAEAANASARAQELRLEAARLLRADGLPMRDVGELIGVSHQRVSQILARPRRRTTAKRSKS